DNADMQFLFRFHADSHWADAIIASIRETIRREKDYALPADDYFLRHSVAKIMAISPLYVSGAAAKAVMDAVSENAPKAVAPLIQSLIDDASKVLGEHFNPKRAAQKLLLFMDFIDWYHKERP